MRKLIPPSDRACQNQLRKGVNRNEKKKQAHTWDRRSASVCRDEQSEPECGRSGYWGGEIIACVAGDESTQIVKAFGNYTVDLQAIGRWLKEYNIKTVAMESPGVYLIPLFEELERQGFQCCLISSRSLRRVPGRKSDVVDCQWIQTLHSYGLLESSFRPEAELVALRPLRRHRAQLLEHRSPHILHMQKA